MATLEPVQSRPATLRELMGQAERLVVVAPHPDDETLGCGALIAQACAANVECRVIVVTGGEHSNPGDPVWTAPMMAEARQRETRAALAQLGVPSSAVEFLGLEDGTLQREETHLTTALAARLGARELVATVWEHDGHPDHDACGRASRAAAARCGARCIAYSVWAWNDPARQRQWQALQRVHLHADAALAERKSGAVQEFATQIGTSQPAVAVPVLDANVLRHFCTRIEDYAT